MALRFDDLRSRDGDTIDRDYLNRRWKLIAENIRTNSDRMDGFAATESQLVELGLQRIDDVLGPALQAVSSAVELGFLVQPSDTAVEMEVGIDVEFTLSETAAKGIFAPTPFLTVMDEADEDSWAVVKRLSYNKETGVLGVRPLYISGTGVGASWVIASSAGVLPAMETALADTLTAKNNAVSAAASAAADKNTVAADKATVLTYRNQAEAAAAAAAADAQSVAEDSATISQLVAVLDDGPVLTVNGRVGAVTLDKTDVGLSNVENTALSTWAGSANITTVGTVTNGSWDATTIALSKGGTGATDAPGARTNLGLVIGTNIQAWDADLDIWATKTAPTGAVVGTTDTQTLSAKTLTGLRETRVAMAANDIDLSAGNYFTKTISGTTTLTVSNVPSSGSVAAFVLDLTNGGSATLNLWSGVKWAGGSSPTLTSAGRDVLAFFTHDAGTTWNAFLLGKDMK